MGTSVILILTPRTSMAPLDKAAGSLGVGLALDVVEGHADDVLVAGDARGQDLRDDRIGDDREAIVDGPGGRRVLQIVHLAQGQHEGEHAILVVRAGCRGSARPDMPPKVRAERVAKPRA